MDHQEAASQVTVSAISPATVSDSRFGYQLTVTGPAEAATLLDAARAAILKLGGSIDVDAPPVIVANFGSQAFLRLAGAFFTPRRKWPVKLLCEVASEGQSTLRLTSSEAFGIGTLVGVEGKFRMRCQEVLNELSAELVKRPA